MHGGSIPDSVINQYCWIQGTFVVPRMYKVTSGPLQWQLLSRLETLCQDFDTEVGWDVSQTGVGPYSHNEDIKVKAYYQWVPFVLFLQVTISSLSAGLPHTYLYGVCGEHAESNGNMIMTLEIHRAIRI